MSRTSSYSCRVLARGLGQFARNRRAALPRRYRCAGETVPALYIVASGTE
jgi:hypothetical protein